MSIRACWLLTGVVFLAGSACFCVTALADEKKGEEETCANPYYQFWARSKKGDVAVHLVKTKLRPQGDDSDGEASEESRITYTLVEVNDKRVVVESVTTEPDYFGEVQSAPTRLIYPKRVNKANLQRFLLDAGTKDGEETMKCQGKEMKCKTVAATIKARKGEESEYKIWLSDEVPGSIVKKVRTTRQKGKLIAETTITLESYKKAD